MVMIRGYWKDRLEQQRQDRLIRWGCVFLAVAILLVLGLVATSHGEDRFPTVVAAEHPPSSHLQVRRTTSDPFIGSDNVVHNTPSVHRNWIQRHPRVFGVLVIGAAAGAGAGIARAQHRGLCTEKYANGYTYVGTNPCPVDH
jgi:hypothetical protein